MNNLLHYARDGIDRRSLNDAVRDYVPSFFPIDIPPGSGANWLSTRPMFNVWWREEIEKIGNDLAIESSLDDKKVKRIFKEHKWEVDQSVEGIGISDKRGKWKYDAYRNRVAIEVELSSRSQVFKDSFKFLIGQAMSQTDVGVIMVRRELIGRKPYFGSVRRDWHAIYTTLPMLNMAFYGF